MGDGVTHGYRFSFNGIERTMPGSHHDQVCCRIRDTAKQSLADRVMVGKYILVFKSGDCLRLAQLSCREPPHSALRIMNGLPRDSFPQSAGNTGYLGCNPLLTFTHDQCLEK